MRVEAEYEPQFLSVKHKVLSTEQEKATGGASRMDEILHPNFSTLPEHASSQILEGMRSLRPAIVA